MHRQGAIDSNMFSMKSLPRISLFLVVALVSSCTFHGQLTPTSGPLARHGTVAIPASFTWSGSGAGKVSVTMPDGEICAGRYFTATEGTSSSSHGQSNGFYSAEGSTSYSGRYAGNRYDETMNSSVNGYSNANSMGYSHSSSDIGYGSAIVTGSKGTVITLNYQTSRSSPTHGQGSGHDNRGNFYTIVY